MRRSVYVDALSGALWQPRPRRARGWIVLAVVVLLAVVANCATWGGR